MVLDEHRASGGTQTTALDATNSSASGDKNVAGAAQIVTPVHYADVHGVCDNDAIALHCFAQVATRGSTASKYAQ